MSRVVTLHCFFSAKGGVGKTTLAVACAQVLPERGLTLVLDADFTGTSLADGFDLCAPQVALRSDGTMDLAAPSTGAFLSLAETRGLRRQRQRQNWRSQTDDPPPPPPYLNDLFAFRPAEGQQGDCRVDGLLWRHDRGGVVRYLPSSSINHDIDLALSWLHGELFEAWVQRFAWLLQTLVRELPMLTDVVVDLPPGLFGFARGAVSLLSALASAEALPPGFPGPELYGLATFQVRPFLVVSQDRQDVVSAVEAQARMVTKLPGIVMLFNRVTEGPERVRAMVHEALSPGEAAAAALIPPPAYRMVHFVGDHRRTLGRLFIDGALQLDDDARSEIARVLS